MIPPAKRPNFLIIVADDLGFSDIGCYGSEIRTPNVDTLASEGLRFTDYHTASVCSPTRSMLLSGTDCHLAGLGVMSEFRTVDPARWNVPGHEGYLNHDVAALPEVLRDAGYYTVMAGKWHLGYKDSCGPHHRGFDRSFAMLPGCANHFGWEPRWDKEVGGIRPGKFVPGHSPPLYCEDGARYTPIPNYESDPDTGFYSSTFYADTLLRYLKDNDSLGKPFLAFLPFGAPHYPLQCSKTDRDAYRGVYDDGPDALRLRRLAALKRKQLVPRETQPYPVHAVTAEWEAMSPEERSLSARAMEIYAGMVTAMDREIGKVVDHLRTTGQLDDTVIMFMSDNSAEGAAMEANPAMGPDLLATIDKYYDNSYENLGAYNSFCWYGPRWAQASTAPGRLYKAFNTEGGIRVPLVIRYPPWMSDQHPAGGVVHAFATCMDVMPSLLDLAGLAHPNTHPFCSRERVPFRGHLVYPMRGKTWLPFLRGEQLAIHGDDDPVGWEMFGRGALRKGRWKINWMREGDGAGSGKGHWELHDLSSDPGELVDLSLALPDKLTELCQDFDEYVRQTGTVWGRPLDMQQTRSKLPADMIGGDPVEDQKAWMYLGNGERIR